MIREMKDPLGASLSSDSSSSFMPAPLTAIVTPQVTEHEGIKRAAPPKYSFFGTSMGHSSPPSSNILSSFQQQQQQQQQSGQSSSSLGSAAVRQKKSSFVKNSGGYITIR